MTDSEMPDLLVELTAVAHALADAARAPILTHFRSPALTADNKLAGGFDPVTIADRQAETAMRAVLAERRPQDAIHGEEEGHTAGTSGLTWVLDPIDGTRAFICGAPTFGVLIAVHDGNRPILGMIDQPHVGERFIGLPGTGRHSSLWRDGQETLLQTRKDVTLEDAILLTTFPEVGTQREGEAFRSIAADVRLTRYGLDCYAYALLAMGQVDLVIEAGLNAYDIQGPMAVIEAAGGVVTNWRGGPCDQGGQILAAGCPELHRQALKRLEPFAH
jgi:histidinol phosphatase-like enzyme (inositol monophosphatase family)